MEGTQFKNPLLRAFLADQEHLDLYKQYCKSPNDCIKKIINDRFVSFYIRIRAISYFSKIIHFTARHFDIERRKYENRYVLSLDSTGGDFKEGINESKFTLKEFLVDETATRHFQENLEKEIGQHIQNPILYKAILSLNERQKQILYLSYITNISDTEISKQMNVTQQAISKSKNNALAKVRRLIDA